MMCWKVFVVGLFVGGCVGFSLFAVVAIGAEADRRAGLK